jgi:hypothetical protein
VGVGLLEVVGEGAVVLEVGLGEEVGGLVVGALHPAISMIASNTRMIEVTKTLARILFYPGR